MERSTITWRSPRARQLAHVRRLMFFVFALALLAGGARGAFAAGGPFGWPSVQQQLTEGRIIPGSALERLVLANQDFSLLRAEESSDALRIPLWLRVLYRKNHPHDRYLASDPTGGYPLVLHEVYEWMLTHQDLQPGMSHPSVSVIQKASETGEERISGASSSPHSESMIRVNRQNTQKIIGSSNDISASGQQAQFFSSNGGVTWGQTSLSLVSGDAFQSDPTVDWTSDGTAWSATIGIDASQTVLTMRAYKSTNGGATWTFDNSFSGGLSNNDKEMLWVDHSATSPFKDNIYVIWHAGLPAEVARRTGPTGSWQAPVQVSGSETTGTAIGGDIKTNANGDVFGFYPDTGSQGIYVVKSTNGGASFSTAVHIANTFGSFEFAIPADASRQCLIYTTAGAFRNSSVNNVFVAWDDLSGDSGCTSGGGPGTNASSTCKTRIFFSRSTDGGATWSAPVKINNQSGLNDQFFPWMNVDEGSGLVSITYYDTVGDSTRKSTNLYYQSSSDNGQTWSAPFKVTSASTNETTSGADSGNQYGDYTGLDGIGGTYFPSWTDRRSGAAEEIWTAAILDSATTPNFAISASPTSTSIPQGGSGNATITTTVSNGFNSAVSLSASGQPSGTTVAFNPTSIAAPGAGSSTMTITVGAATAVGTYTITVTGTGGSTTHTATVTLTVTSSGFSISASPTSTTIAQGSAGNVTISTTASGTFNSAISLSAAGQPSGTTVAFNPTSIAAPGTGSSTMTITVGAATAAGTYTITVTGTGGSTTNTTTVTLTVAAPDFTISASPTSATIAQGSAGNVTVTTAAVGGFNSAVALSAAGQPTGVTVAFNPTSIAAPGSGSSTMTITVAATAATGTSTITITGTGGGKTHTATVSLTVTTSGPTQLLGNPGFENGTNTSPWTLTAGVINNSSAEPPHSGSWDAWLDGYGTNHTDTALQTVTIPSTITTATLSFWLHIDTAETTTTTAFDVLKVQIRNTSGTVLSTLATFSNLNHASGYTKHSYDVSAFKGQTIQVFLTGTEDVSLQTSFVVDDFTLNVQ